MKEDKTIIEEFNNTVNMTAKGLKEWLKTSDSYKVGLSEYGGSNESIGHNSGRQIVEILESNPKKDPDKYSARQLQHMRRVLSYW
jgi:hypothetical protein